MIRSFFFAVGIYLITCGMTCLFIDRVVFNSRGEAASPHGKRTYFISATDDRPIEFYPPAWLPFSLLTLGAVTTLYAVALPNPRRMHQHL